MDDVRILMKLTENNEEVKLISENLKVDKEVSFTLELDFPNIQNKFVNEFLTLLPERKQLYLRQIPSLGVQSSLC